MSAIDNITISISGKTAGETEGKFNYNVLVECQIILPTTTSFLEENPKLTLSVVGGGSPINNVIMNSPGVGHIGKYWYSDAVSDQDEGSVISAHIEVSWLQPGSDDANGSPVVFP